MDELNVKETIKSDFAVSADDAVKIFNILNDNISSKNEINVNFSGLSTITTSFFNISIGDLYTKWSRNELNEYIHIKGNTLTSVQRDKLALVMNNTKSKLNKNPKTDEDLY